MIEIDTVLVDMDGVLVDFIGGSCHAHGHSPEEVLATWPTGQPRVEPVLNLSVAAFWQEIDAQGRMFWEDLEAYPWMPGLVACLEDSQARWYICSSPARSPESAAGKMVWLYRHVRMHLRDFVLTPRKELLARPTTLLIDDNSRFVERFRAAGGRAILFPQPWNQHGTVDDPLAHVLAELKTKYRLVKPPRTR